MPRKQFLADLNLAQSQAISNVHDICKGDDDGQVDFLWTSPHFAKPVKVTALVTDIGAYPKTHDYTLYTDDEAPAEAGRLLQTLGTLSSTSLPELMSAVSSTDAGSPMSVDDEDLLSADDAYSIDSDDGIDFDSQRPHIPAGAQPIAGFLSAELRTRMRSDIQHLRDQGYRVGFYGAMLRASSGIIAVSKKIKKLGVSTEAMAAWSLSEEDYLVLLIRYRNGYRSLESLLSTDFDTTSTSVEFRLGMSSKYKPASQDAFAAFDKTQNSRKKEEMDANSTFVNTFISRPLNEMVNERLLKLLDLRCTGYSWGRAEKQYTDLRDAGLAVTSNSARVHDPRDRQGTSTDPDDHFTLRGLRSFPLLAMQFVLRHFLRCTEFCLVCHRKLNINFEALKPYVCENPLCLYQYMTLGFGPRIEHEIATQPVVTDLLISFCYKAAAASALTEFPNGLSITLPRSFVNVSRTGVGIMVPTLAQPAEDILKINTDMDRCEGRASTPFPSACPYRVGDWVVCQLVDGNDTGTAEHCRVSEIGYWPTIRFDQPIAVAAINVDTANTATKSKSTKKAKEVSLDEQLYGPQYFVQKYDVLFDDLPPQDKQRALMMLLDTMPSVVEMKSYLESAGVDLQHWLARISPSALAVLRWIIASNRSCIVHVPEADAASTGLREERVTGMNGWQQFRFAMGAPDKEKRFVTQVTATKARLGLTYPTLFAWHGSPIKNWHSIIRKGLHFETVANGRAYGSGIYFSPHQATSMGYCGYDYRYQTNQRGTPSDWPSSTFCIKTAMALNEIVNAPAEYVSHNPHYVVDQLDWIQTRYLFVKSNLRGQDGKEQVSSLSAEVAPAHAFPQDPARIPYGEGNTRVIIPASAVKAIGVPASPTKRRGSKLFSAMGKKGKGTGTPKVGTREDPIDLDGESSDVTDDEDRQLIKDLSETTAHTAPPSFTTDTQAGAATAVTRSLALAPTKATGGFMPGALNHDELPKMKEPSDANTAASRRLQKDFRELLKVQAATPPAQLGWYIDPEKLDNVYQWIVELHSFDQFEHKGKTLPLAVDMKKADITSIVLEIRFPGTYPMSPPFVRVIQPRFLGFAQGGGGHVTAGGAMCMELLTNSGWSAVSSIESVLLQVRLAIASTEPAPARLEGGGRVGAGKVAQYGIAEAVEAFKRAVRMHGWAMPPEFDKMVVQ